MLILGIVVLLLCLYFLRSSAYEKNSFAYIWVDYDEYEPETYAGVVVDFDGKEAYARYNTGNFTKDLALARKNFPHASHASSVELYDIDRKS